MTEEEEAIITLYASKTVAKFNKNQNIGICNARVKDGELEDTEETQEADESEDNIQDTSDENLSEIDSETGKPIVSDEASDLETTDLTSEEAAGEDTGYSFTDAIGIDGIEFTCSQFDVSEEYSTSKFVLSKIKGKKYLILSIDATNNSESSVDFSNYNRSYSLSVNGGEKSSTQMTPLSNDLANYDGVLAAGDSKTFILVFLFSNSSVEDITSLELFVTSDGTTRGTAI